MGMEWLSDLMQWLQQQLLTDSPTPDFLSDVAAFEAMVIALSVPLSYDIVSRISDKYKSDVIAKRYRSHLVIRWLPPALILNIIFAVGLKFFVGGHPDSPLWRLCAWLVFLGFIVIALALIRFFWLTMKFGLRSTDVLERLFHDAEEAIK